MFKEKIKEKLHKYVLICREYLGLNYQTWERIKRFVLTWGFTKRRQFEFIQDFSSWLNDGCSPSQACRSIIDGSKADRQLQQEYKAASAIYNALSKGQPISEGMTDWFDSDVVALFGAGQKAGAHALSKVVDEYLRQELEIKKAKEIFWTPVRQPFVYFLMSFGFMLVMGIFVLPQFSEMMPANSISFAVKLVLSFSEWVASYSVYIVLLMVVFFLLGWHFVLTNTSKYRLIADRYFPLNIYRNFAAMKTLKTLGILVETRYNLHRAASELKRHSTPYMVYHLNHVIRQTQFGESDLGEALNSGLLSKRLIFRLKNAANSPDQDKKKSAISIAADRSGDEAVRALKGTRQFVSGFVWIAAASTLLLAINSFMGVLSSLFNMSYR